MAFQDPSGDPAPLVQSRAPYGPHLSMAALFVHQAFLPVSIAEFVWSQGWMIVILDGVYTVWANLLIELPAGIYAGAVL